jgi:hypothetical protein
MLCGSWPLRALWPEDEWLQARYGTNATTSGQGGAERGVRLRHLVNAARGRI